MAAAGGRLWVRRTPPRAGRLALVLLLASDGWRAAATPDTYQASGRLTLAAASPAAFAASSAAQTAIAQGLVNAVSGVANVTANCTLTLRSVDTLYTAQAPQCAASPSGCGGGGGVWGASQFGSYVEAAYSFAADAAAGRSVIAALKGLSNAQLATLLTQALAAGGASALASGLQVLSSAVSLRAYTDLGGMGGSTAVTATFADGTVESYEAAPARWNAWQPNSQGVAASCPTRSDLSLPSARGQLVAAPAAGRGPLRLGQACAGSALPPSPRSGGGAVLVAVRGGCTFLEKVVTAQQAGYCGLVVANLRAGPPASPVYGLRELPDMTVEPQGRDADVALPAWIISKPDGDAIVAQLTKGAIRVAVEDAVRKPALGPGQEDAFGLRDPQTA